MRFDRLMSRFPLAESEARAARQLSAGLPEDAPQDWRQLAAVLAVRDALGTRHRPVVLGISGGQGAGKTTLARLLVAALALQGRRAERVSLDDFYLTRPARQALADNVHPLLATRGVPGTHDVALALAVLRALRAGEEAWIPVFDKTIDDRRPQGSDRHVHSGADLLVFEGWCLGAPPQPAADLHEPVNDLERYQDPDGRWRGYVNDCLAGEYQALWRCVDELLFLEVPDLASVIRWRLAQEAEHPAGRRMARETVEKFVAHYERLTRWMLMTLPRKADLVGVLDRRHVLKDLYLRR